MSGDWAAVILATTDNFDFTGGDGGAGTDVGGGVRRCARRHPRPRRAHSSQDAPPGAHRQLARLGRLRAARRPRRLRRRGAQCLPAARASSTGTCRSSRTSRSAAAARRSSAGRSTTCRTAQWSTIDTVARFNPQGAQVNPTSAMPRLRVTRGSCKGRFGSRSKCARRGAWCAGRGARGVVRVRAC